VASRKKDARAPQKTGENESFSSGAEIEEAEAAATRRSMQVTHRAKANLYSSTYNERQQQSIEMLNFLYDTSDLNASTPTGELVLEAVKSPRFPHDPVTKSSVQKMPDTRERTSNLPVFPQKTGCHPQTAPPPY